MLNYMTGCDVWP